jgi:hypothetical protein
MSRIGITVGLRNFSVIKGVLKQTKPGGLPRLSYSDENLLLSVSEGLPTSLIRRQSMVSRRRLGLPG